MNDFIQQIRAAIGNAPDHLICDCKTHRFSTNGKSGDKAGWYVHPHLGVVIAGCWRAGVTVTLFTNGVTKDDPEAIAAIQRAREAYRLERAQAAKDAATKARDLLSWSKPLQRSNEYAMRKRVFEMDFLIGKLRARSIKSSVLIDMVNAHGELVGAQVIQPDGTKRFVTGTNKRGAWHWMSNVATPNYDDIIGVCEGWATGCAVSHMHGLKHVAVAFDAGNLEPVVSMLLILYPHNKIIVFADDDDVNPKTGKRAGMVGAEKARAFAKDRVSIEYPFWPDGIKPAGCSDFSDKYLLLRCQTNDNINA